MKIRIRIHRRASLENILMTMALFFVSSYALLEHVSISIPFFSGLKFPMVYMGGIFMLPYIFKILSSLRKKKFFYPMLLTLLMFAFLALSAYFNRNTMYGQSPMRVTLRFVLYWMELFLLMVWVAETGRGGFVIRFLFWYTLILVAATDFLLLTKLMVFRNGSQETYLVGNKFTVAYLHMDLLALWFVKHDGRFLFWQKSKVLAILLASVVILVSVYVDCMTGLLGCIVLIWLFASMDTPVQTKLLRLNSPGLLSLVLLLSLIFPFVSQSIVSIPAVEAFLNNVLGRSNTLTGRINIFEVFIRRMEDNWLWGYGFGNGNVIAQAIFGYANAQNAILNWVLQAGVFATGSLLGLIVMVFRQLSKAEESMKFMPLVALIYVYVVMGAVETTFSMAFLMWIAVLFMLINETRESDDDENEEAEENEEE